MQAYNLQKLLHNSTEQEETSKHLLLSYQAIFK
jgi:hypothetical protein